MNYFSLDTHLIKTGGTTLPNSKKYQTILFDLDGTLTDPKIGITKSVQYALKSFGIEESLENLIPFIGPPLKYSFVNLYQFDEAKATLAIAKYREYFAVTGLYENELFAGVPELLQDLRTEGKTLALATSKPTVYADQILEHFKIREYFTFVAGSNLDGSRVEKAEVIAYALKNLGVSDYSQVIMIGDRKHDLIGAKTVGVDSIGVLYGYGSHEELSAEVPTWLAKDLVELREILL